MKCAMCGANHHLFNVPCTTLYAGREEPGTITLCSDCKQLADEAAQLFVEDDETDDEIPHTPAPLPSYDELIQQGYTDEQIRRYFTYATKKK